MAKYLDPKADVTFKKVFGEHKNLVISLLNALLPLDDGKQVESIEYMTPEMVPETPLGKNSIVDVRCEETGGRKFIVEMQMEWFPDFMQRVLLNASKAYVRQLPKGNDYNLLQPVYSLSLVNHTFEPELDGYYHYYHLVHDLHTEKVLDGLHLVFVELPKFKAKNLTEKKMQVLWLRFLTEIAPDGADEVSQDLLDNPQTGEALELVRESGLNDEERAAYEGFWDRVSIEATKKAYVDRAFAERDAANARADAAVARANAAIEKIREDKLQTARNLKAMNLTNEQIAAATGLTVDEIAAL
ncbi:MAG: Rpn family recombination-promoting nuclease/putative transposase [Lentisphaerae bacterium]|nr:Rpn family recombination-promoting nuclease/putative transposase [Lentisphaerota bacterium]